MTEKPSRTFKFLPLTMRLDTLGGIATPLVLRGTPLPASRSETFSTAANNQKAVSAILCMGESPLTKNNLSFGEFKLDGIPAKPRGIPQITIEFTIQPTCIVTVRASLHGSDLVTQEVFQPPKALTDTLISKMLTDAEQTRPQDDTALLKIETTTRANNLLERAEASLKLNPNTEISAAIAELGLALSSEDIERIRERADHLDSLLSTVSPANSFASIYSDLFGPPKKQFRGTTKSPVPTQSPVKKEERQTQGLASSPPSQILGKIFGGGEFTLDSQLCFVLMPFAGRLQQIYEDHIRTSVESCGLRCERADEIHGTTLITWDIWEKINRSRFLIADLTDQNANVFYEMGLAHALSKDVILLTQSMDYVPFDLKSLRCIRYEFTPRGMKELEDRLIKTIKAIMKSS